MSSLLFLLVMEDIAKVVMVEADRLKTVLITARWRSLPTAGPALKLGQYNQRKRVPAVDNK